MYRKVKPWILTALSAAVVLMAMTACAASSADTPSADETYLPTEDSSASHNSSEPLPSGTLPGEALPDTQDAELNHAYDELVERFCTLAADPYGIVDIAECGEFGVIESAQAMGDNALNAVGYAVGDLSGDGIPELVVGVLPEYGGLVNAVYTLVDGQPQFVFEGWYRSSYTYLGSGRFFCCASGGASETGMGVFSLTGDGTALICEEFYFTHAADGELSDVRVYFNTTGSWDTAESEETDLSLEGFWAWEPEYVDLPLIPFSDYAAERGDNPAGAPVGVQWGELIVPGLEDYVEFAADDEYAAQVLFTTLRTVTDFELVRLTIREVYDDGTVSYFSEPIYYLETLTPECPLVVRMAFPGDLPAYGISYVDEYGSGMTCRFTVGVSGEDGTLLLQETYGVGRD